MRATFIGGPLDGEELIDRELRPHYKSYDHASCPIQYLDDESPHASIPIIDHRLERVHRDGADRYYYVAPGGKIPLDEPQEREPLNLTKLAIAHDWLSEYGFSEAAEFLGEVLNGE